MFYKNHTQCDLLFKSSCTNRYLNYIFQVGNCCYNNSTIKWKSWNLHFYSSNIACRQYWLSEQICLELKVWMLSFLNIRSSRLEVSCKKVFFNSNSRLPKKNLFCLLHWKPSKDDAKCFLFHLKSSFCSQDIYVFIMTFFLISNFLMLQPG